MKRWSDDALLTLLDSAPNKVEKLVARRPDLADRLDRLTTIDAPVCRALSEAIAPDPDLQRRVRARLARNGGGRDAFSLAMELFAIPMATAEVLLDHRGSIDPSTERPLDAPADSGVTPPKETP